MKRADASEPTPTKPAGAYRVLHTADWHLGKTLRDLSRETEHARFLEFLLEEIKTAQVDLLIIAGDIFDSANPPQSAQSQYYEFLSSLFRDTDCHCLVVGGNHDSPAQLEAPARVLSSLRTTVVGSALEPGEAAIHYFPDKDSAQLAIAAIPFLRDRDLRTGNAGQRREDIESALREGIRNHYQRAADAAPKGLPLIATGHLTVTGSSTSESERDIHIGGLGAIDVGLFPKAFQYVALGHLHRPQSCGKTEHIRYSGSPIPLSFSEASDRKRVRVLDFLDGDLQAQHARAIPLTRPLHQLRCKRAEIATAIAALEPSDAELEAWVELVIEDPVAGEDVMIEANAAAELKPFTIIQVIAADAHREAGASLSEDASELESDALLRRPKEVFSLRLEQEESLSDDERAALTLAFAELTEQEDPS